MDRSCDIAIIGGGPGGCTAAIYAAGAGLKTIVLEKLSAGGQMAESIKIENYPGFETISGLELAGRMKGQVQKAGAEIMFTGVRHAELKTDPKILHTVSGDLKARAVVIATGAVPRKLGIPGEEEFYGRGVTYCASCDGRYFRGKTAAVVGGGYSAAEDASLLSRICEKVYIIHRRDKLRIPQKEFEVLRDMAGIEFIWNTEVTCISGKDRLERISLFNNVSEERGELKCDGLFIAAGRRPASDIFSGEIDTDESGYIIADETTRTSLNGVFAAGDVRRKPVRQIVSALADGAAAVKFAKEYIDTL